MKWEGHFLGKGNLQRVNTVVANDTAWTGATLLVFKEIIGTSFTYERLPRKLRSHQIRRTPLIALI